VAAVVVDTDVVSFLFKRDARAESYRRHLDGKLSVISFMTVAELYRWSLDRRWGSTRCAAMEEHLHNFVVYPFHRGLCRKWAEASHSAKLKGRRINCADAWVAATALLHGIPLVTHNRTHFAGVDNLVVISESEGSLTA